MATISKALRVPEAQRSGPGIDFTDGNGRALMHAAEAWFTAASECQREMIGFVSLRLEKHAATTREIMDCRNLADMAAIHSRWMEETLRDYSSEMDKLTTICTVSINGGAGPKA